MPGLPSSSVTTTCALKGELQAVSVPLFPGLEYPGQHRESITVSELLGIIQRLLVQQTHCIIIWWEKEAPTLLNPQNDLSFSFG